MKTAISFKPSKTTSPKSKKHAGKEREKEKIDKRKAENIGSPHATVITMEPSEMIAFLMDESPSPECTRLSSVVVNYAEQSIFEPTPHEISYSLAEDLSYKLSHIIHDAQIKANLSGRRALLGTDVEASLENLMIDKVFGANNKANFIPLTDKLLYLDDTVVSLVKIAEEVGTVVQPADITLKKQCYPEISPAIKNYARYFEAMCHTLISTPPRLEEALQDIRKNPRIGPIVNWFYNFSYILLSKDNTYVALTLSALHIIEALESNAIARQVVGEHELKLLLRLILQRLLRTHTEYEVIKPMCRIVETLCKRVPLHELVINKIAQRQQEFNTDYALPLVCIINALGANAVTQFINHLLSLFQMARRERSQILDLLTTSLLSSYWILTTNHMATLHHHYAFHDAFSHRLIPFWNLTCHCVHEQREVNWRSVKSQLLKSRRKLTVSPHHQMLVQLENIFIPIAYNPYIRLKWRATKKKVASTTNGQKVDFQVTATVGKCSMFRGSSGKMTKSCLHYLTMIL